VARRAEEAVRTALPAAPAASGEQAAAPDGPSLPRHRITAREPDARLRLPECPGRLTAVVPVATGGLRPRTLVQVGCGAPQARWTVLVPVTLETDTIVLVTTRRLARGDRPGPGDLATSTRTLPGISSLYVSNLNEIRSQHLTRPLEAGQPLTHDVLAADPVVRRGEAVTLVADLAGVEVRMPGRALADAGPGEIVRAQNVNSLKIVEGRADDSGRVRVDR
jgi:flagella basal body P-ring formation protein FlgA